MFRDLCLAESLKFTNTMTNSLEREHVMLSQNLKEEKEYQISYKGLIYDSLQRHFSSI
jgi:hypothetical protein